MPNAKRSWAWAGNEQSRGVWSPDGALALVSGDRGPALLIGEAQAAPVLGVPASGRFYAAVWAPDSRRLLLADRDNDYRFSLVDVAHGQPVASYVVAKDGSGDSPQPVGFLPDGKRLLVWSKKAANITDAESGRTLSSFEAEAPLALFTPRGWLAHGVPSEKPMGARNRGFRVVDVETGRTLFESDRLVSSFVWSASEPRLAMSSDGCTLVWDPEHGLRELSVRGKPAWSEGGTRLAFGTLDQYSSGSEYRCEDCLQPVPWQSVFDFETLREVPTAGFVPAGSSELLPTNVIRNAATGAERELAHWEPGQRVSFRFLDDETLLGVVRPLYFRVDLRTGKVTGWERAAPTESIGSDDETFSSCEGGRWAVYERFSRRLLGRLPEELGCARTAVTVLKLPLVQYSAPEETRVVDLSRGQTLARLQGGAQSRSKHADPVVLHVRGKPTPSRAPGKYDPTPNLARCEIFDVEKRRRLATPEWPAESYGANCDYDPERGFVGGPSSYNKRFVYREGRGFLRPDGGRTGQYTVFCNDSYKETPNGAVCFENGEKVRTFRVWNARTDRVRVVRLDEQAFPMTSPTTRERRYVDIASTVVDANEERLAFFTGRETLVLDVGKGTVSAWGPLDHRPTRWLDSRTLVVTDRPLSGGRERAGGTVVVKDGLASADPPPPDPRFPLVRGFMPDEPATMAPSKRFAIQGVESPYYVTRASDGAYLELIVASEDGRPYTVLVDADGHFAGDDQAAATLSYGVGSGPWDAVLRNGVEMAAKFRDEARLRTFVGAR